MSFSTKCYALVTADAFYGVQKYNRQPCPRLALRKCYVHSVKPCIICVLQKTVRIILLNLKCWFKQISCRLMHDADRHFQSSEVAHNYLTLKNVVHPGNPNVLAELNCVYERFLP